MNIKIIDWIKSAISKADSAQATADTARATANTAKATADAALPKSGGTIDGQLTINNDLNLARPGDAEGGQINLLQDNKETVIIDRYNNLLRFWGTASKKEISFDPSTGVLHCPYTMSGVATSAFSVKSESIAYGRATTGFTLPDGGTWFVFATMDNKDGATFACPEPTVAAGGTYIGWNPYTGQASYAWAAIKVY